MAGTPEMQEHFPAGAWMALRRETRLMRRTRTPKMQDAFSGGCLHGTIPVNIGLVCRCPGIPNTQDSGLQLPQVTDGSFMFLRRNIARVTILDRFRRRQ